MKKYAFAILFLIMVFQSNVVRSQFLMDMVDTTKEMGKDMLGLYQKFNYLRISGYMQPQFQFIGEKGAETFAGPAFGKNVDNRFTLRRGRIRFDYARFNQSDEVSFQFAFQFDGTERGVNIRDFWGRLFENKWQVMALTGGMFARPFGYEVNLSSSDRESPERGRMSQILMKTERDLGAMLSFEPRKRTHPLRWLKVDAGIFNGQGLAGPAEYDSYKDFIARAGFKPVKILPGVNISAAISYLNGGILQNSRYIYSVSKKDAQPVFVVDSSLGNLGSKAPRQYAGADIQLVFNQTGNYKTVLRAEYWKGKQSALSNSSETPGSLTLEPVYIRRFDGAYFYLLQNIGQHQIGVKYDWYDPNTDVSGTEITKSSGNFHPADIKYNTIGLGYINYINENLKLVLWYDIVNNENTLIDGYANDLEDNVFTCRLQFRF